MFTTRISNVQAQLKSETIAAMALLPGPNLLYLSGMHTHLSERPILFIVPAEGDPGVVIPLLEAPKAIKAGIPESNIFPWGDGEGYRDAFVEAASVFGLAGKTVAVEALYMRVLELDMLKAVAPGLTHVYADPILTKQRLIKEPGELEEIERAVAVAEAAMHKLIPQIKIGMTEKEIAAILTSELIEAGAHGIPFGPIVSAGPNGASPHAVPTDRPIAKGDLMIIDWGAIINDYPSDITRTFAVGELDSQAQHMFDTVLAANRAGVAASEPESSCAEVDIAARQIITDAGLGQYFIHRTGHGLGLEVHEPPNMIDGNEDPMLPGMVFTVEPGVYIPDVGGVRIEDDVVITPSGYKVLTTFPRELMRVG